MPYPVGGSLKRTRNFTHLHMKNNFVREDIDEVLIKEKMTEYQLL